MVHRNMKRIGEPGPAELLSKLLLASAQVSSPSEIVYTFVLFRLSDELSSLRRSDSLPVCQQRESLADDLLSGERMKPIDDQSQRAPVRETRLKSQEGRIRI